MNKDFERCCSFLADMIIKYALEIKEEVEMCMMIKDSIDDEKVSRQKQFDRLPIGMQVSVLLNRNRQEKKEQNMVRL